LQLHANWSQLQLSRRSAFHHQSTTRRYDTWTRTSIRPILAAVASRLHLPLLALATLATWALTIALVSGMDAGPGTDLGGLASFIGVWVTMMGAMMLPSVAPMVLTFAHVNAARARQENPDVTPTWIFVAAYIGVWTGYGLAAYTVFRLTRNVEPGLLAWDRGGRYVAGGAIVAAALYELTPVKEKCLRHCRSPLHFLAHSWRDGTAGAVRLGAHHGLYCVGCCFGLFVILFAVGAMSLFWMVVIATIIFVEKVLPFGTQATWVFAVALAALGVWIMLDASSVPGFTEPGRMPMHSGQ
jgi:predicted metal-binding membrane protein